VLPRPRRARRIKARAGLPSSGPSTGTLKHADPFWPVRLRKRAIEACLAFVSERLNGEDGLGAIYPAIANSVMMYDALGYPDTHPERAIARKGVDKLLVIKDSEAIASLASRPVWDKTPLSATLCWKPEALRRLHAWTRPRLAHAAPGARCQGDGSLARPQVRPGGWAFQYGNAHYPDLDDTAVVVMAYDRMQSANRRKQLREQAIARGREWSKACKARMAGGAHSMQRR